MAIVAVLLILGSVGMFLLPWLGVNITENNLTRPLESYWEEAAGQLNTSPEELRKEYMSALEEPFDELRYQFGVEVDKESILDFADTALKGKWSPKDVLTMIGSLRRMLVDLNGKLEPLMNQFQSESEELQDMKRAEQLLNIAYYVYLGLLGVCALMALIAVICVLTDHRGGVVPYMIFAILTLGLFAGIMILGNRNMEELLQGFEFDLSRFSAQMKLGLYGPLAAGLAVLAYIVTFLPIGRRADEESYEEPSAGTDGWLCPNCNVLRRADQKFCLTCGMPRPDLNAGVRAASAPPVPGSWKCPGCGTLLKPDQRFCLYCGSRRPGSEAPTPAYTPARAAYPAANPRPAPAGWTCPRCGARLDERQQFWPRCGTGKPGAAPTAAPMPARPTAPAAGPVPMRNSAGWSCPRCGALLDDRQKFCPRCGTGKPGAAPAPAPRPAPAAAPRPAAVPRPAPAPETAPRRATAGWTCQTCGAVLQEKQRFCPNCGTGRPEEAPAASAAPAAPAAAPASGWTCQTCGARLKADQKFCPRCGSKRPAPAPAAAPAAPSGWTCPSCGSKLQDDQRFCPRCGSKRPAPAAPVNEPAPAPAPRICADCGYELGEGMDFCPKCGRRFEQPVPAPAGRHARPEPEEPKIKPAEPEEPKTEPEIPETPLPEETAAPLWESAAAPAEEEAAPEEPELPPEEPEPSPEEPEPVPEKDELESLLDSLPARDEDAFSFRDTEDLIRGLHSAEERKDLDEVMQSIPAEEDALDEPFDPTAGFSFDDPDEPGEGEDASDSGLPRPDGEDL